jgi:hypothetical protein
VQENVQRHAELFQNRLKTAVQTLTGAEVRFPTPDVALVHYVGRDRLESSHWRGRSSSERNHHDVMVKTNGKWLITAFQNTESWVEKESSSPSKTRHRRKRFIVSADEKLTAFLELESQTVEGRAGQLDYAPVCPPRAPFRNTCAGTFNFSET